MVTEAVPFLIIIYNVWNPLDAYLRVFFQLVLYVVFYKDCQAYHQLVLLAVSVFKFQYIFFTDKYRYYFVNILVVSIDY